MIFLVCLYPIEILVTNLKFFLKFCFQKKRKFHFFIFGVEVIHFSLKCKNESRICGW